MSVVKKIQSFTAKYGTGPQGSKLRPKNKGYWSQRRRQRAADAMRTIRKYHPPGTLRKMLKADK